MTVRARLLLCAVLLALNRHGGASAAAKPPPPPPPPPRPTLYSMLGVSAGASDKAIKRSYHKLALRWHPDKHPSRAAKAAATARFKSLQSAYETLRKPRLRRQYDAKLEDKWARGQREKKWKAVEQARRERGGGGGGQHQQQHTWDPRRLRREQERQRSRERTVAWRAWHMLGWLGVAFDPRTERGSLALFSFVAAVALAFALGGGGGGGGGRRRGRRRGAAGTGRWGRAATRT